MCCEVGKCLTDLVNGKYRMRRGGRVKARVDEDGEEFEGYAMPC